MVVKGFIGQAPNPGNRLRNQVEYKPHSFVERSCREELEKIDINVH
jgi:hypothetical protein